MASVFNIPLKVLNNVYINNNNYDTIINGVISLKILGYFNISNNIAINVLPDPINKAIILLEGNNQFDNSSLLNNNITSNPILNDNNIGSSIYKIQNFLGIFNINI